LKPRQFNNYRTYKRYLQNEFTRLCVYCRQPDCSAPNLNFGVDHYRPKSINRFAKLECEYSNLYYCCSNCNSRKNDDWPVDETAGPYVVNPCEHEMTAHLRFDSQTGLVESKTANGQHTVTLLQLNDIASVQYRLGTLKTVTLYSDEIRKLEKQLIAIGKLQRAGNLSQSDYDRYKAEIENELQLARTTLQSHNGDLPLPPLQNKRKGIPLLIP